MQRLVKIVDVRIVNMVVLSSHELKHLFVWHLSLLYYFAGLGSKEYVFINDHWV